MKRVGRTAVNSTGAIVGARTKPSYRATVHGWVLTNTDTVNDHNVVFHEPAALGFDTPKETAPASSDPTAFTLIIKAGTTLTFYDEIEIEFPRGVFVIADNAAVTGVVLHS